MLRKELLRFAGICLAVLGGASGLEAQMMQIPNLRGAPFQAVNSVTVTDSKGMVHPVTQKVARDSSGSTYQELHQLDTDELQQIFILDVVSKRSIRLDTVKKYYFIQELPSLTAHDQTTSVAEQIKQALEIKPTHHEAGGISADVQPLGKKEVEGLVVLGELKTNRSTGSAEATVDSSIEKWTSPDLQIALRFRARDGVAKTEVVDSLSQIQRSAPDPSLFMIPADYVPDPAFVAHPAAPAKK